MEGSERGGMSHLVNWEVVSMSLEVGVWPVVI